jgi:hypothetical protein
VSDSVPTSRANLQNQLAHAVAMAAKEDQIVWAIFGVFWAANSVLLGSLISPNRLPRPTLDFVVSAAGATLCWVWFRMQYRAIAWLRYYETVIGALQAELKVPSEFSLIQRNAVGGRPVRPLMTRSGIVVGMLWLAAHMYFAYDLMPARYIIGRGPSWASQNRTRARDSLNHGDATMGSQRYTVEDEKIGKWLIEVVVESAGLETDEATRVTITDNQTGRSVSGAGSDYAEALEVACRKMGISPGDIDDEIEED